MCGIIGVVASDKTNISEILKRSLAWLTYRGYDSCGIAVKIGNEIKIDKHQGTVEQLKLGIDSKSRAGIGHTRWATHGRPTEQNAHPHISCSHEIAVVHNGIISNYLQIKEKLKKNGHKFNSETDTEVIPHLIEQELEVRARGSANFLSAFAATLKELEGTYAIAVLWSQEEKIYAARKTSPLLIGVGQDIQFVSSDIPAFLQYTNRFVPVEDGQIAVISANKYELCDLELNPQSAMEYTWPFDIEQISKGNNDHYMQKEILEQGTILEQILSRKDEIESITEELAHTIKKVKKIYLTGCGSSFHACLAGKYMFERLLQIPTEAILSSEFKNAVMEIPLEDSFVIALSQSGETYDTYIALDQISSLSRKPPLLVLVNNPGSSLERLAKSKLGPNSQVLQMGAKPEICVVATKTYTAQLYLLALLCLFISSKIASKTGRLLAEKYLYEAQTIPQKVSRALANLHGEVEKVALKYKKYSYNDTNKKGHREDFIVIGRGINLATASEIALKLKEVCYMSAEALAGGELKHGSLAIVDKHTPVIILFPPSTDVANWKSTVNNFMEVQARKAPIIAVLCERDEKGEIESLAEKVIWLPDTEWLFRPILQVIPFQFWAYRIAREKKIDPDHPRNLAKTVTVE